MSLPAIRSLMNVESEAVFRPVFGIIWENEARLEARLRENPAHLSTFNNDRIAQNGPFINF